jgi:hypothetical protein
VSRATALRVTNQPLSQAEHRFLLPACSYAHAGEPDVVVLRLNGLESCSHFQSIEESPSCPSILGGGATACLVPCMVAMELPSMTLSWTKQAGSVSEYNLQHLIQPTHDTLRLASLAPHVQAGRRLPHIMVV